MQRQLPNVEIAFRQDFTDAAAKEAFRACEVCFGNPPVFWIENSETLHWLQLDSAGLDPYQGIIKEGKIKVSNLQDFFSRPAAESTVAGILSLYRKLHVLQTAQGERKWVYNPIRHEVETIEGKSILILGAGSIGRKVGDYLLPFGGTITFYTRRSLTDFHTTDSLEDLGTYDIIVGCLAEAPETIDLLNAERLSQLKPTAIIANVGRGSLIDEKHLVHMLKEGKLAGAFLDVTRTEPIPADSPLWDTPNLLLGQHTAGGTRDEVLGKARFCVKNFRNYLKGKPENVVRL